MIRILLVWCAATLFFPLMFGCATLRQPSFEILAPSEIDVYVCGYIDAEHAKDLSLTCAPYEKFIVKLQEQRNVL